jgi:hypothetical protein
VWERRRCFGNFVSHFGLGCADVAAAVGGVEDVVGVRVGRVRVRLCLRLRLRLQATACALLQAQLQTAEVEVVVVVVE